MTIRLHGDALLREPSPPLGKALLTHAGPQPLVEVWIAYGLRKRWRVVSLGHTYGEWDSRLDARSFLDLLVAGNPDLVELA